jgi:hypothetical protein
MFVIFNMHKENFYIMCGYVCDLSLYQISHLSGLSLPDSKVNVMSLCCYITSYKIKITNETNLFLGVL